MRQHKVTFLFDKFCIYKSYIFTFLIQNEYNYFLGRYAYILFIRIGIHIKHCSLMNSPTVKSYSTRKKKFPFVCFCFPVVALDRVGSQSRKKPWPPNRSRESESKKKLPPSRSQTSVSKKKEDAVTEVGSRSRKNLNPWVGLGSQSRKNWNPGVGVESRSWKSRRRSLYSE